MSTTKPAVNVRPVRPRVCAFCAYYFCADGTASCKRRNGINADVGDMLQYEMTCDRWTNKHPAARRQEANDGY